MNKPPIRYVRKLSGEESLERYILVLEESLKLFPKPGTPFKLQIAGQVLDTQIKAVDCWCRGPRKPHVHYRIDLGPFVQVFRPHFGQSVSISKVEEGLYKLE